MGLQLSIASDVTLKNGDISNKAVILKGLKNL
jgi:hypothetical protein